MFGVVLGGSHYRREQLTDNREVGLYDALGPTEFDIRQYVIERWSNSLFGGVEFVPSDNLRLFLKGIFAEFNDDEQRNQYELRLDRAASGTRGFAAGNLVGVPLRGSFNYGEYRNQNTLGTFGADYETPTGFSSSLRLNYTKTENTTYLPLVQASTSGTNSPSISYDASDPRFPLVTLFQTVGPAPLTRGAPLPTAPQGLLNAAGAILIDARQATEVDAYTARLDLTQDFENGLTLKGGAYYVDRQINGNNFSFSNVAAVGAAGFNVNSYLTNEPWDTQFPLGFTLNYVNNVAMRADIDALLAQLTAAGRFNPANGIPATDLYDQNEKILAGYVSAELALDNLTVIGGLRVENYEIENAGTVRSGTVFTPITVDQSETDLFPSLNLRYEASDDLILRLAAQRGISRPAYGAIRVGAAINDTSTPGTIGGGNPNLLPEMTWGVDASAEYYLPTNGIVSVTGFYRWVDNVFYQGAQLVTDDTYDTGTIDRTGYLLSGTFNGENGRLYGVEFNVQNQFDFLPAPFDGFGVQGNLTLLEGEYDAPATATLAAQTGLPFQGLSDTIVNASLYYEKYGFSARVSYQWRSDWEDTLGGLGAGETRKGYENLDVSLRYAINENLTVFADLANLTDEYYVAYTGRPDLPSEVEQIGERYLFGIRVNY
jgi:TonB-dependent receptor